MSLSDYRYCIDSNVLIQAWQKYYAPEFCPDYWDILNDLGIKKKIFLPEMVFEEIARTDDELSKWLKGSHIPIQKIDERVTKCLHAIYDKDPQHKYLVDNTRARSLADPWVIAHAMHEQATVVTKEEKLLEPKSNRIKIPNVCENMGIRWINDFELISELQIKFSCKL